LANCEKKETDQAKKATLEQADNKQPVTITVTIQQSEWRNGNGESKK